MGEDLIENKIYVAVLFGSDLQGNALYKFEPLKQISNATFVKATPEFKRGDILISTVDPDLTVIFDKMTSTTAFDSIYHNMGGSSHDWCLDRFRHATKEEEQEFFDELEADGKRWNTEAMEIEDILKKGDLAIFWDNGYHLNPLIRLYNAKSQVGRMHFDNFGTAWDNAIKWDGTKEQFEKISGVK